ncbi:MAG: putative maltokinase, partial [Vicinamibacterales bacterium]
PGPYAFMWFELQQPPEPETRVAELDRLHVAAGWESLLAGPMLERLESALLPAFLLKQRWFGGKSRSIRSASVVDWGEFASSGAALAFVDVWYDDGAAESYLLALAMNFAAESEVPTSAVVCPISSPAGEGVLHDAAYDVAARDALLAFIERGGRVPTRHGVVTGTPSETLARLRGPGGERLTATRASAEQSNTSIIYGKRLILKLFRRQEPGVNPDCEVGRYLTEVRHFAHVPAFAGTIDYTRNGTQFATLAMLQALVSHQGDGWTRTLERLDRYFEECASSQYPGDERRSGEWDVVELSEEQESPLARESIGISLDEASMLGQRTAEMHVALSSPTDDRAFAPEPLSDAHLQVLGLEFHDHAGRVFDDLKEGLSTLPDEIVEIAGLVLSRRRAILETFRQLGTDHIGGLRTRIHGDYHLGQVVAVKNDYVILDFEGEPSRSLVERRAKHSPLKDVAGMLRSFSYAAWAALLNYAARRPESLARLEPWANFWQRATAGAFLRAYRASAADAPFMPATRDGFETLLEAYVLDKALYELQYELNHRPDWVRIPLHGVLELR